MTTRPKKESAVNALRMLPTKWAIVILAMVIGYVVLQPRLNEWFGWSLPSVASLDGEKSTKSAAPNKKNDAEPSKPKSDGKSDAKNEEPTSPLNDEPSSRLNDESESKPPTKAVAKPKRTSDEKELDPLYSFLTDLGRNRYQSPAGLVYGPGSEEGHRIKHIARHLEDQPTRPGSHGVFKGDMRAFLVAIDDAYTRAKKGAKGTTKKEDEGSVVYEVTFEKAIGFIGGEAGGRKKNPAAKKIRLVVRGDNVITAFPF
jgi:hypothetical protein